MTILVFGAYGVVAAAFALWVADSATPSAWMLAGVLVAAAVGAGATSRWALQLGLVIATGVMLIAIPFSQSSSIDVREVWTFLAFVALFVVGIVVVYRRMLARSWDERWLDAPVESPLDDIGELADDRTQTLNRLGFELSHAYRLAPQEDPLAVVYVKESERTWAEVTYPRRDELNAGWAFTSLAGSVALSTQQTRVIPAGPGDLIQALVGTTVEEGYRHHVEAQRLLRMRGIRFDLVDRAALRTAIRRETSEFRVAFRESPYRQARIADRVRRDGVGFAVGPLFEQDDVEDQITAALGLVRTG